MRLKHVRESYGLTRKQVSDLLNIPLRTIENWEMGQRKCPEYVEQLVIDKLEYLHQQGLINKKEG